MRIAILNLLLLFSLNFSQAQSADCPRKASFGTIDICLPEIPGYTECYLYPAVHELADLTESEMNEVLGFYLNDAVYAKRDSLGSFSFDDYFKLYATTSLAHIPVDKAGMKELNAAVASNFLQEKWEEVKDQVGSDILNYVEAPIVMKSYEHNDRSFSHVMLVRYELPGTESYVMAVAMSGLQIHNRIVWLAYYQKYQDEGTMQSVQDRSNAILSAVLKANS